MTFFKPTSVRRSPLQRFVAIAGGLVYGTAVGISGRWIHPVWYLPIMSLGSIVVVAVIMRVNPYTAIAEFWRLPRDMREFKKWADYEIERIESEKRGSKSATHFTVTEDKVTQNLPLPKRKDDEE